MTSLHAECIEFALLGFREVSRVVRSPIPGQSLRGGFALPVEQIHPTSLFTRSHKERNSSAASSASSIAMAGLPQHFSDRERLRARASAGKTGAATGVMRT
jgi:hypothetical protein